MIKFVLPILFSVVCVFAQAKTFNTYAICTAVDDIRYCAVMPTESKMKQNLYEYVIDTNTYNKVNTEGVISQAFKVREYYNGNEMLNYYTFVNNSGYSMVDVNTQCYIKKYFYGSIEELKKEYYYIDTDVSDIEGFIGRCIMSHVKKSDKMP